MKYGCIGERLKHSFSKEIHNALSDYEYELVEVARDEFDDFLKRRDFLAINVTIPYKERIIPYLHGIDESAKLIGAVNTVVNRDGALYGYNTDFYGMTELLGHAGISVKDKKVLILGTGGTSKTAAAVAAALGAREILRASRSGKEGAVTYEQVYELHTDTDVIINTTPSGMFPDCYGCPVDIDKFKNLSGVIDAVYNPLRTRLVSRAKELGIPAEGGLYMLVAQAVRASEIFTDKKYPKSETERVFSELLSSKENIVLTGMPASGKSTVGRILADMLGRKFIDTDSLVEKLCGMSIAEYFEKHGEEEFRLKETEAILDAAKETSAIIATGGGAILKEENVRALRQNGKIFFIDRPLESLVPTSDRPTASDRASIEKRYKERYSIYLSTADAVIAADTDAVGTAEKILAQIVKM